MITEHHSFLTTLLPSNTKTRSPQANLKDQEEPIDLAQGHTISVSFDCSNS